MKLSINFRILYKKTAFKRKLSSTIHIILQLLGCTFIYRFLHLKMLQPSLYARLLLDRLSLLFLLQ